MTDPLLIFDGKYYPDKVSRCLVISERMGGVESHLVPIDEDHLTHGRSCSCEPAGTLWQGYSVVYHHSDLSRVVVPDSMPEEL